MSGVKPTAAGGDDVDVETTPAKRRVRRVRCEMPAARKEQLRQAYAAAAADPAFLAEMAELDRAFDVTVGDGLSDY